MILGITLPAFLLRPLIGPRAIALIYLLSVVLLALFVGRGPTLLAAALSAVFWDFFFLEPIADLGIRNAEDAIMFGMYFVVALVLGQLTARIRAQERSEHEREKRATALYRLTRELLEAASLEQLLQNTVRELERAFTARIVVLLPDSSGKLSNHAHPASSYDLSGPEQPVAAWAFEQGQPAGKFARELPHAETLSSRSPRARARSARSVCTLTSPLPRQPPSNATSSTPSSSRLPWPWTGSGCATRPSRPGCWPNRSG